MSLRHALLALLDAGAMTGYELAKQFDVSVAYLWHAPHSQIYPELRRMEADGLIEAEALPRGERGTKRAYSLTVAGAAELMRWVAETETSPPVRDPAYLKATYYEYGSFDQARRQFREHRDHHRAIMEHWQRHIARLQRRDTPLLQKRLSLAPAAAHEAIVAYKVHAYEGLVERARAEVAWAERGLSLIDRLEHNSAVPPDAPATLPQVLTGGTE
ncbi:PadR family transcriptional regulator [Planosporangium mesophilum]|uniref:Transcriptional regulator n=1 Tax=Planosporangium mesophilum TaxID=689768 RepID=A0A8J3TCK5_9ACTN|nr:PadR family transcriptional regulator [Planosporangium mesophilum]NJC84455.1 PadR family transcriptional regulator [Planosporangium mesophilum]GII23402.1 transcriptional regulator [Planosporangium mesophilum]